METTSGDDPETRTKAQIAFDNKIEEAIGDTDLDVLNVVKAITQATEVKTVEITAQVAGIIFRDHNDHNRDMSIPKANEYCDAMVRGEWKKNHQGIAFYTKGTLADGQHRMAGLALSGKTLNFVTFPDFEEDSIDSIDQGKGRTAADALKLKGIENPGPKASLVKIGMVYKAQLEFGRSPKFSVQQIEHFVLTQDTELTQALEIGNNSIKNVSEPCLTAKDASVIAYLMADGRYPDYQITGFLASIQQGVATYPEAPTVDLSRQFLKAKLSDRGRDHLTPTDRFALSMKGANLWATQKSVSRLRWNKKKETLPSNHAPESDMDSESEAA